MCELYPSTDVLFYTAKRLAKQTLGLQKGDRIIITGGTATGTTGNTNTIRVETI